MDWSNPSVQEKAKNIAAQQTGVFSEVGMIYAPYYRQGEYFRVIAEAAEKPEKQVYTKTGIEDIRRAFRYYMEHYNKGRPFILFGHSQGAMVLLELMKSESPQQARRRLPDRLSENAENIPRPPSPAPCTRRQ